VGQKRPLSWSSDGRFLLVSEIDPKMTFDLWVLPMTGERKPAPWLNTPFTETLGQFSPDGRWIAYQSNESGSFEIYVQPFSATGAKWQISTQGGSQPRWRADGKELFFIAPDTKVMAATVTSSATTFVAAPPVALFQTRIVNPSATQKHLYAVSRDGRFLINELAEDSTPTPITLEAAVVSARPVRGAEAPGADQVAFLCLIKCRHHNSMASDGTALAFARKPSDGPMSPMTFVLFSYLQRGTIFAIRPEYRSLRIKFNIRLSAPQVTTGPIAAPVCRDCSHRHICKLPKKRRSLNRFCGLVVNHSHQVIQCGNLGYFSTGSRTRFRLTGW
jgi:dipeptidyl aminopeptidase/acylaminoacyl peptidase